MYPKEVIKAIYRELPEELIDLVASDETLSFIEKTAEKYNLSSSQWDMLGLETSMRIIGVTLKENFGSEISKKLSTPIPVAIQIATEIESGIISKIPPEVLSANEKLVQQKIRGELVQKQTLSKELEVPPTILPMVEPGEISHDTIPKPKIDFAAHSTPQTIQAKSIIEEKMAHPVSVPAQTSYQQGQDPYREPTE